MENTQNPTNEAPAFGVFLTLEEAQDWLRLDPDTPLLLARIQADEGIYEVGMTSLDEGYYAREGCTPTFVTAEEMPRILEICERPD